VWILVDMTDKTQHTDRRKLWQVQNFCQSNKDPLCLKSHL